MKSTLIALLIMSAALARAPATADSKVVRNINLTDARDIADAIEVNDAISVWGKDASHCPAETSRDRQACVCGFSQDQKKLKAAYAAAVSRHPGWNEEDTVVAYRNAANGNSVILNFSGIKRQLDTCAQPRR